jgi:phage-related protein
MTVDAADLRIKIDASDVSRAGEHLKGLHGTVNTTGGVLKSFAGTVTGVVTGFASLAAVRFVGTQFKGFLDAGREANIVAAQTAAVLTSTRGAAGMTAQSVDQLAMRLSGLTGVEDDAVAAAENMLLTFTNIKGTTFPQATKAALDMATAMNGGTIPAAEELRQTSIQLGKALNDPAVGMTALQRVGVTFSAQQKEQIKDFQAHGQLAQAQAVILAELTKEFGGSAEAAGRANGGMAILNAQWQSMKDTIGQALIPILSRLGAALAPVLAWLAAQLPGAIAALQPLLNGMGTGLGQVGQVLRDLWPTIQQVANSVGGQLTQAWGAVWPYLQQAWPALQQIGRAFRDLLPAFTPVGTLFQQLLPTLAPLIPTMATLAAQVGTALSSAFRQVFPTILNLAQMIVRDVLPTAQRLISTIAQALVPVIQSLAPVVTQVIGIVSSVFRALWPVLDWIINQLIIPAIKGVVPILQGVATFLSGVFSGNWGRAWDGIKNIFVGVWNLIKTILGNVLGEIWNKISGWFGGLWGALSGAAQGFINNVTSWAGRIWDAITKPFRDIGGFISNALRNIPFLGGLFGGGKAGFGFALAPGSYRVSQGYSSGHPAIDEAAAMGTPLYAVAGGRVTLTAPDQFGANRILIDHGGGLSSFYAHMSRDLVGVGQSVARGQLIGLVGSTGQSTGPHLHFMLYQNGRPINPRGIVPYDEGGWVREPVAGVGLRSGRGYTFGESGPEYVSPAGSGPGRTVVVVVDLDGQRMSRGLLPYLTSELQHAGVRI